MNYNSENPGVTVNKSSFARVFRRAYLASLKPETIINGFRHSGTYPPNRHAIDKTKLQPAKVYEPSTELEEPSATTMPAAKHSALKALEEELSEETLTTYQTRLEEGYDLQDPLYSTWKKLKQKSSRVPLRDLSNVQEPLNQPAPVLKDILQVPKVDKVKPKSNQTMQGVALPKHISSDEVITFLEEKKAKKEMEKQQKIERKQEREEKKRKKEEEKREKAEQREKARKKKIEEQEKAERKKKEKLDKQPRQKRGKSKRQKFSSPDDEEYICPECQGVYSEETEDSEVWIEYESCEQWYHLECAGVQEDDDFICQLCTQA